MVVGDIVNLFPEDAKLKVTFRRQNGVAWLIDEPVTRPYISAQYEQPELPTIRILSSHGCDYYTDFSVEYAVKDKNVVVLYGPNGSATFSISE